MQISDGKNFSPEQTLLKIEEVKKLLSKFFNLKTKHAITSRLDIKTLADVFFYVTDTTCRQYYRKAEKPIKESETEDDLDLKTDLKIKGLRKVRVANSLEDSLKKSTTAGADYQRKFFPERVKLNAETKEHLLGHLINRDSQAEIINKIVEANQTGVVTLADIFTHVTSCAVESFKNSAEGIRPEYKEERMAGKIYERIANGLIKAIPEEEADHVPQNG